MKNILIMLCGAMVIIPANGVEVQPGGFETGQQGIQNQFTNYDFTVDWGDNGVSLAAYAAGRSQLTVTHSYTTDGEYQVTVYQNGAIVTNPEHKNGYYIPSNANYRLSCPDDYPESDTGASSISDCYNKCENGDGLHKHYNQPCTYKLYYKCPGSTELHDVDTGLTQGASVTVPSVSSSCPGATATQWKYTIMNANTGGDVAPGSWTYPVGDSNVMLWLQ